MDQHACTRKHSLQLGHANICRRIPFADSPVAWIERRSHSLRLRQAQQLFLIEPGKHLTRAFGALLEQLTRVLGFRCTQGRERHGFDALSDMQGKALCAVQHAFFIDIDIVDQEASSNGAH
jgi:hypothetical protein